MQRGMGKGKGRVYTVRPLFISFFFHLTNVLTSTTAPPPAEHEERALYGTLFVFSGSYGLPHPTEHEKRDHIGRVFRVCVLLALPNPPNVSYPPPPASHSSPNSSPTRQV